MTHTLHPWRLVAVLLVAVAGLAACNEDDTTTVPPATVNSNIDFSIFATQAFSTSANSTPAPINTVNFTFDANDEPTAFDALIASGSYQ